MPDRRDVAIALAVVAAVVLVQLPFWRIGFSLLDEGAILQIAADIVAGKRPYADAVHYAWPGVFYLTAAAFALFGASIEVARALAVGIFALTSGLVYLIARWWLGRAAALALVLAVVGYRAWAYPHWQTLSYSTLAVMLALLAVWIAGAAFGGRRRWPFALAGATAALATLAKQDSGFAATLAVGTGILAFGAAPGRSRPAALGTYVAAGLAVAALAVAGAAAGGFLPAMLTETVWAPLYGVSTFEYHGRPPLWPLFEIDLAIRENPFSYLPPLVLELGVERLQTVPLYRDTLVVDVAVKLLFHLPWMVLLAGAALAAVDLARAEGPARLAAQRRALVVLLAGGFLLAFNRPHDWVHLLVLYLPTLLLASQLAARLGARGARRRTVGVASAALLVAFLLVTIRVVAAASALNDTPLVTPRGTLWGPPAHAVPLRDLLARLDETPPDAPVLALPYHPLVNFLAARPGLSRYYAVWPVEHNAARDATIIARLESQPNAVVVYSPTQVPHFPPFAAYAPTLNAHLEDHYEVARTFGGAHGMLTFFELARTPPPAGRPLELAALVLEPRDKAPNPLPQKVWPRFVRRETWAFRPVLAMGTVPVGTLAAVHRLTPPAGSRLETSFGQHPAHWTEHPAYPVRFTASVRRASGEETVVVDATRHPAHEPDDRRWTEVNLSLDPWAGETVELVLRVTGPPDQWLRLDRAAWEVPRLVEP